MLRLPHLNNSFALDVEGAEFDGACVVVQNVSPSTAERIENLLRDGYPHPLSAPQAAPAPLPPIPQHCPLVERFADVADGLLMTTEKGGRHPLADLMTALELAQISLEDQQRSKYTCNLHPSKIDTLRSLTTANLLELRAIGSSPRQIAILLNCHAGYFIDDNAVVFTPWPLPEVSTQQTNFCVVV